MLKYLFRYTLLPCAAALLAVGCNDEVFVDAFLPESPEIVVERSGEASTLRFKASNWDVLSVMGPMSPLYGDIYDASGRLVARGQSLCGEGLLTMVYDDGLLDFRIERSDYRELSVVLGENLRERPYVVHIAVGNEYETGSVTATLAPSGKYRVDSVAYDWNAFFFTDNTARTKEAFTIDNTESDQPVTMYVSPYRNEYRTVRFWPESYGDHREEILGLPLPEVRIPDTEEGRPVFGDASARFVENEQRMPLSFSDEEQAAVTVPAGQRLRIEVLLVCEEFRVPYTLYVSHPVTGRRRTFAGTLFSSVPYHYYIFKTDPFVEPSASEPARIAEAGDGRDQLNPDRS